MSWFKRFLGKDEEEQAAPAAPVAKAPPAPSPSFAEDETRSTLKADGKKVKLNFKKIPNKVVEAMAAETTGQPRTIVMQDDDGLDGTQILGADLTNIFNAAAKGSPMPKKPMMKGPKP